MTENEYGVIRLEKDKRYGELLYIGDLKECNKAMNEFINDGTCKNCKVMSYEQIIEHELIAQKLSQLREV